MDVLNGATRFFDEGRVAGVYIDGFEPDSGIPEFLSGHGLTLVNPLTLKPYKTGGHYLLAYKK